MRSKNAPSSSLRETCVCSIPTVVTEAHQNGDEFGYERLLCYAAGAADASRPPPIKEDVLQSVDTFIDHGAPHDDLTLVVVRGWDRPCTAS